VPTAVVGSIALALSSTPASAAESRPAEGRVLKAAAKPTVKLAPVPAAASAPTTYTVKRGDTVSTIAARHGLRTTDVLALNGLKWSSVIYPGQVLKLRAAPAAAPVAKPAAPAAPAASGTYTVRAGDTISTIAGRHGVSTQAMLSANRLGWSSIIYPGQKLTVPGKGGAPAPAAKPAAPAAKPAAPAAPAASGTYVVRAGDTIWAIASRHGVSVQAMFAANKIGASSIIYPGQKLTIPAKGSPAPAAKPSTPAPAAVNVTLDAEQIANVKTIIAVGRQLGVPDRGIAIALGTAMQESWIRNLDWGDRDSLGLFQQRPSYGWGTAAEVRDPVRATKAFFGGPSDPNGSRTRGLLEIPGWQSMSFADAAQAVQISAYPDRYARWEKPAYAWLAAYG
jgi:LysM repeat protein